MDFDFGDHTVCRLAKRAGPVDCREICHALTENALGALLISTTTMTTNADESINNHLNGDEEVEDGEDDGHIDIPEEGTGTGGLLTAIGIHNAFIDAG